MSGSRSGFYPIILLFKTSHVKRALEVSCPICKEQPGQACKIEDGRPAVHDARESIAYNNKKIWT